MSTVEAVDPIQSCDKRHGGDGTYAGNGAQSLNVRIGDDHLVSELLQATSDPLALSGSLDEDPPRRANTQHLAEPLWPGLDALLEDLPFLGDQADLAFGLVHVDANVFHGWPPRL